MSIYGLEESQHDGVGRLLSAAGITVRRGAEEPKRSQLPPDSALRVMILSEDFPVYSPRTSRACAYFVRDLERDTITIEMFGDDLSGYIDVWIDGWLYRTDCQFSTEELRWFFGFNPDVCRVTAFPGLWEFSFAVGEVAPFFFAEPGPGTSSYSNLQFRGGVVVNYEGWVSVDDGDGGLDTVEVVDTIPFSEGEVSPGAIAIAKFSSNVGWFVDKWHCREFRFYPEQR